MVMDSKGIGLYLREQIGYYRFVKEMLNIR